MNTPQYEKIDQYQPENEREIKRVAPYEKKQTEKQQDEIAIAGRADKIKNQENREKQEKEGWRIKCHYCRVFVWMGSGLIIDFIIAYS